MGAMHKDDPKSALRRQQRLARNAFYENLGPDGLQLAFSQPPSPLRHMFEKQGNVSGYWPVASEADPRALLSTAQNVGCTTALPYIAHKTAPMAFLQWKQGDALENGAFGMQQPAPDRPVIMPDIVLLPLIAFDRNGGRIGQGGGHYDRALSLLPNAVKIGVAWSVQEVDDTLADPWDIPMDFILTEREWIAI
jgi:5-formyltetrahydrofolate cyclo-ligase